MGQSKPEDGERKAIEALSAATGFEWHPHYNQLIAFAHPQEADILAAFLSRAAASSQSKRISGESLGVGGVGAAKDPGVYIDKAIAEEPFFQAAIGRENFKSDLAHALKENQKVREGKKKAVLEKFEASTGYEWELRQHDKDTYHIETYNDAETTLALYRVLEPIQRKLLGNDSAGGQLKQAVQGQGLAFHAEDPREIHTYGLPDNKELPESQKQYCLTVPHALIEHTEFVKTLPDDLNFQITQALRKAKQEAQRKEKS